MSKRKLLYFSFFSFLFLFFSLMNFLFRNTVICVIENEDFENDEMEYDFVDDLMKMDIFEKDSTKLKKEIYEQINETHFAFSVCKVCIKIIQMLNKIIERSKEKYVDIAIEETLEMNLCDSKIWEEYFHFNEILYNEHILDFCEYTKNKIQNDIEKYIYKLYKNEKLFIKTVCEKLYPICNVAIKEEEEISNHIIINKDGSKKSKIKLMFDLYAEYLIAEKQFKKTPKGLPYKIKRRKEGNSVPVEKDDYILIQSKIKVLHKHKLLNDIKDNNYRLLKIEQMNDKIQELFLLLLEQDELEFFFFLEFCKNETLPSDSIFEIEVKLHKVSKDITVIKIKEEGKLIKNNNNFLLLKNFCS